MRDSINHNRAAYVPGLLEIGDTDTILSAIAPRPFLLSAGEGDPLFPIDGVRRLVESAQMAYDRAYVSERFRAVIFPGKHSFPDIVKDEVYSFLDHWLQNKT